MKRLAFVLILASELAVGQAYASGTVGYGSRVGMEVSVISMSGLDTARATMRTKHTRENAEKFCREYVGNVSEQCIEEELGIPLNDVIHGNCLTGVFEDFYGNLYRFEGKLKKKGDIIANYALRKLSAPNRGELADGTSASGYWTNMAIFGALCPLEAPSQKTRLQHAIHLTHDAGEATRSPAIRATL
jgi:hypothetical protein